MQGHDGGASGWHIIASHDDAASLIDTLLGLDPDGEYTKTELSDAADVPLKSLYLDGTLDAIVELGLLDKDDREGEATLFTVNDESDAFAAASAFDIVVRTRRADSA